MVRPYRRGEDLEMYAKEQAQLFHGQQTRRSGEPYISHIVDIVTDLRRILPSHMYRSCTLSSGWLHDSIEDTENLDVLNPFTNSRRRRPHTTYLNDLLEASGENGRRTCYMVDKLTHRGEIHYDTYMGRMFTFSRNPYRRDLDILALIIKMSDRTSNAAPHELIDCSKDVDEYRRLEGSTESELKRFYARKRVLGAYAQRKDYSFDPDCFENILRMRFKTNKVNNALMNIHEYIPRTEGRLLLGRPRTDLYRLAPLRRMLKRCVAFSIEVMRENDAIHPDSLAIWQKVGSRAFNLQDGYTPIFTQVSNEIRLCGGIAQYLDALEKENSR